MPVKSLVYYTDNRLDGTLINETVIKQIKRTFSGEIICVSLEPVDFGKNVVLSGWKRGIVTMFEQIFAGLTTATGEIVYFAEHDVLYTAEHFAFIPPTKNAYYYNENAWRLRAEDGQALFYWCKQTSGLCAYRELLLEHYRKRLARIEQEGTYSYKTGFEPGCHRPPRGIDSYPAIGWQSGIPNIDIRHNKNLTPNRFSQELFRNKNSCQGWTMADAIPGWGITKNRFTDFLKEIQNANQAFTKGE